jgi:amidohydrolase family protein/IPT/TIG domain-containing protein
LIPTQSSLKGPMRYELLPSRHIVFRLLCIFVCLAVAPVLGPVAAQTGSVTVIEGGTLIDGTGAPAVANSTVVIQGDRILSVGRAGEVNIPAGARRIDARGQFLIPGLTDGHVHLRDWAHDLYLVYGVTSVIEQGGDSYWWDIAQKEAVEKGKIRGPRIFTAGTAFRCRGTGMYDARVARCDSEEFQPANLRRRIQDLAHAGAAWINIGQFVPPPLIQVMTEEAHKQGIPVCGTTLYPREAVAAGVDAFTHVYPITIGAASEAQRVTEWRERDRVAAWQDINGLNYLMPASADPYLEMLLKNKVYLIPVLVTDMRALHSHLEEFDRDTAKLLNDPELDYIPKAELRRRLLGSMEDRVQPLAIGKFGSTDPESQQQRQFQQSYHNTEAFLREYVKRGGKVLPGSDQSLGTELHHELQLLVDAGLTPMQAIESATLWPAQFLRKENELGTIRPGRFADILLLDANPLDNIANTKRIRAVIKGGVSQELRFHRDYVNPIPHPPEGAGNLSVNPLPQLKAFAPGVATEQSGSLQLKIRGSDFIPRSMVEFDSTRLQTKFVSETELTATVPAYMTDRVGSFKVTVYTPGPGGGMSEASYFIVKFK